jgi:Ran GTPase-activating protein (RanGAP) involved in mRNA processing and transport
MIGDEGMLVLADSLKDAIMLQNLDISLNEIGPAGFQALCEVLPNTNISNLICNKNFLGDDVMAYFSNILADPSSSSRLKKFDFSACRLNDVGLIYLINALQNNKVVFSIKLNDNFFSENVEAILLETLNKNTTLTEIAMTGNRFSHSCLQKIKKITQRNIKMIEEHEPNKLKAEIYRLRYEH